MPRENIKFYSILSAGLAVVVFFGLIVFFNNKSGNSKKMLGGTDDIVIQRFELEQSIAMNIAENKNLSSSDKQELENMTTNFFSSISAAEGSGGVESTKITDTSGKIPSPQKKLSIFDKPVEKIFPADYLGYVGGRNNLMNNENFASASQTDIKKISDVFDSMRNLLDFSIEKGIVSKSNYVNLHNGLTVIWPMTLEMEYGKLQSSGIFQKIFSFIESLIPKTFAQAGLCFRPGTPIPGGVNMWAPCCNCYAGKVPIGCLNSVCVYGAAIYDQVTGICGCG